MGPSYFACLSMKFKIALASGSFGERARNKMRLWSRCLTVSVSTASLYASHVAGRRLLVLDRIVDFHREYRWS